MYNLFDNCDFSFEELISLRRLLSDALLCVPDYKITGLILNIVDAIGSEQCKILMKTEHKL